MVMGVIDTMNIKASQLRRNLSVSEPPIGTFLMTVEATCPAGWSEDSDFEDRYPLGSDADLGTTGGTEAYNHTHTLSIAGHSFNTYPYTVGSTSSNAGTTWYPPFFKVRFCVKD